MKNNFTRLILTILSLSMIIISCSDKVSKESNNVENTVKSAQLLQTVNGNIGGAIQIDGPPNGADLFSDTGISLNTGAILDWVADSTSNSGINCLTTDGIATCVEPNITGAVNGTGHWNGLRLIDLIGSNDKNIFLSGGKENDTSTWNIGPGSVGSSKYDISQAYVANDQDNIYFGMERSGNNGTTAFDFEFNQLAPQSLPACPQNPLIPCRSIGDVLFTFEMQGSGNSGSAIPHIYTWNGSIYVEGAATGILSSINTIDNTKSAPWGHVDSHGTWVLSDLERFTFAEAVAPITLLPGVDSCGGKAFVQVRTRSSSVATSDLKDTTKIFQFIFKGINGAATLTSSCDGSLAFTASGFNSDGSPLANPVCHWTFSNGMTADICSGSLIVPSGEYTAIVDIANGTSNICKTTVQTTAAKVFTPLTVHLALQTSVPSCPSMSNDSVTYNVISTGGNGTYSYAWNDASCTGVSCTINPDDSVFCYNKSLLVTLTDDSGLCPSVTSETETYNKVTVITSSDN